VGRRGLLVAGLFVAVGCASGSDAVAPTSTVAVVSSTSLAAPVTAAPTSTIPPTTAEPQPRYVTGTSDELFDQATLHTFELTLPEASLAVLDEDPAAEEYVEGSMTFDGETLDRVGIRYKGSVGGFILCTENGFGADPTATDRAPSGAKSCNKLSLKVKINWEDSDTRFYGVKRVQLHSQNLDPTLMHERLGYWLFGEMGVPAPRSTHARVVINGEYVGLFALTEQIDESFATENFADGSGNIYKEVWPFDGLGAPQPEKSFVDALENNTKNPDVSTFANLADDLAKAEPGSELDVVGRYIDVDTLLRTFVVDRAIDNEDGALHWYCFDGPCAPHNFYWYEDPSTGKVTLIPWDLDNALDSMTGGFIHLSLEIPDQFGDVRNDCQPFPYGVINLMQRSAGCDPLVAAIATLTDEYAALRAELIAGPMSEESINAQLDEWSAQIEPAVAEAHEVDPTAPTVEAWREQVEKLRAGLVASLASDGR
jgi:spore coat protein CotH